MRRGFTLLELLVTVGIMGLLGVAAAGGYGALVSGMKARGVCASASALLRAAQERAAVDRVNTVVYCYNVCLKEPASTDDSGIVVGMMTAVRLSGRVTYVSGKRIYDEFADLDLSYEWSDDESEIEKSKGHRLFKYDGTSSSGMKYSNVADVVFKDEDETLLTLFSGAGVDGKTNLVASAFYNLGTSDREPGSWKVGDGYGFEFAEIQLPAGYVFGQSIPSTEGSVTEIKAFNFTPDARSTESVQVWSTKPNASGRPQAFKKAGEATANEDKSL